MKIVDQEYKEEQEFLAELKKQDRKRALIMLAAMSLIAAGWATIFYFVIKLGA